MCGEHFDGLAETVIFPGSSPHVRGAPYGTIVVVVTPGIIPACAGSTYRHDG